MSESPKQRMRSVCLGLGLGLGDVGVVVVAVVVGFERPLEDLFDLYGDEGVDEGDSRGLGSAPFAEGGVAMVRRKWQLLRCESRTASGKGGGDCRAQAVVNKGSLRYNRSKTSGYGRRVRRGATGGQRVINGG